MSGERYRLTWASSFFWPLCYLSFFDLWILITSFGIFKLFLSIYMQFWNVNKIRISFNQSEAMSTILKQHHLKGRVMVFNVTFNNISVVSWWRKPEYLEKSTDLPHVTDKHNVVSSKPRLSKIQTPNISW